MFKIHADLAHLQQLKVVDQSTLATPGQVAAPTRDAPDARGDHGLAFRGHQEKVVS